MTDLRKDLVKLEGEIITNQSEKSLNALVKLLSAYPIFTLDLPENYGIYRNRVFDIGSKEKLTPKSISYRSTPSATFSRAGVIGSEIFYGTLSELVDEKEIGSAICVYETSEIIYNNDLMNEYTLLGLWKNTASLKCAVVGWNSEFGLKKTSLSFLERLRDDFLASIDENAKEKFLIIEDFLNQKFTEVIGNEESIKYAITAYYCNYLFSLDKVDAILFPSIKGKGNALNIAMQGILSNKVLQLEHLTLNRTERISGEPISYPVLVSIKIEKDKIDLIESPSQLTNLDRKLIEKKISEGKGFAEKFIIDD